MQQARNPVWKLQNGELPVKFLPRAPQLLSATERCVGQLAARGMTNREVAAALFISPKTVEANLARAYDSSGSNRELSSERVSKE